MRIAIAMVFLSLVSSAVFAEDKGRLPNGAAYRTDENGTQLVDYIAELEVSNESLEAQVKNLQAELSQERSKIGTTQALTERSLVGENVRQPVQPKLLEVKDVTKCPSCVCPVASCDAQIHEQKTAWEQSTQGAALIAAERREDQVAKLSSEFSAAKARYVEEIKDLKLKLLDRGTEIEKLQAELKTSMTTARATKEEVVQLTKENDSLKSSSVIQAKSASEPSDRLSLPAPRASFSATRNLAVESVRGQVKTDLNQLSGSISLRDRRFREYAALGRNIKLTPVPAVSRRGLSLNEISSRLKIAQGIYELSQLKRDLMDINAKVQDDMALMDRMMRSAN